MKKTVSMLFSVFFPLLISAQLPGDTIVIPTINYSQTFSPNGRDTMIQFPDNPGQTYEKIIMSYNMRCKDGQISVPGNTNLGCGEWDYKCNTFITDSSRVDSILSYHTSHSISHFSGDTFYYVETPTHNYYQYLQQQVQVNEIISETQSTVGTGSLPITEVIQTDQYSGKSMYLFTQEELVQAGVVAGSLDGIILVAMSNADAGFFRVKMKQTDQTVLDPAFPHLEGFTEVYSDDYVFASGENRIQFYNSFEWDGTSNVMVEFSFTNEEVSGQLLIKGEEVQENMGMYAQNQTHIVNDVGYTHIPAGPLSAVSEKITVSFWVYGNPDFLPSNTSIISGVDDNNNRQLNIHLPWGNSSVYFDCGYNGGYDRINKGATATEISGQWNHWAFTKNAVSGEMKIYLNGELWHSGSEKYNLIDIQDLILGDIHSGMRNYFGKIDELRIWNKELDQATIAEWMNVTVDETHPQYSNLLAYYKFDEGTGTTTSDASAYGETAELHDHILWGKERGENLSREFSTSTKRPNVTFLQGEYDLTITENIVTVDVENLARVVKEYEIIPRYGTMLHDSIHELSAAYLWPAGYEYIFDPGGQLVDSIEIIPTGYAAITELTYYRRYPALYEIMSFVTPYGIYLDLGMEGKTWYFDVTDFATVLKGWKRMQVTLGGQRQEDMDIRFWFVLGTPPHNVMDINQIWRPASVNYPSLMDDRAYEPRDFKMDPDGEMFKVRSVITGHGQQGEFTPRWHTLNIDGGEPEFEWKVWTECSTIPIYPQGGTWLFDRAGWCPGDPSDVHEFNITPYVSAGQTHTIDYDLTYASGTSNYQLNNQLVTYGPANFNNDAAIVMVTKPNAKNAAQERFNPACTNPTVIIKNTGSNTLTSLDFEYFIAENEILNYSWTGSLHFLATEEVELPVPEYDFWAGDENTFTVNISNPNGEMDEYEYNNTFTSCFEDVDLYDVSDTYTIVCKTNEQGYQTSYSLTDQEGNVILEMDDLENSTLYENDVTLEQGCYKLQINDTGDNGLYYWYTPGYGAGYFMLKDSDGSILKNFEPEFGRFAIYEFGVVDFTGTSDLESPADGISIFPNPASDFVNLRISGKEISNVNVSLFNASMMLMREKQFSVSGTDHSEYLSLEKLQPGMYFLEIVAGSEIIIRKIIKR